MSKLLQNVKFQLIEDLAGLQPCFLILANQLQHLLCFYQLSHIKVLYLILNTHGVVLRVLYIWSQFLNYFSNSSHYFVFVYWVIYQIVVFEGVGLAHDLCLFVTGVIEIDFGIEDLG